ncbi:metallophosphoesterase [Kaistia geumhonensis]|uniref:Calcineurin-like phosphoesterase domain-containing protein n=1 Tax=Kaistia geumhonensis TaxID=410839 RepID=A0ABU0M9V8_9HYPH|nr:metallophosphoesterase [Kaistia geumhonensis]MCX5480572.1 metallophosphoesterase [Kaistia geumhonensis]MDQ0517726.1 hypothetical protein [Kaistia geumhonensis]
MPFLDPRLGDVEDDASSTKSRSLSGLAGSLLAEISLPKLFAAWLSLVALPVLVLGLGPLLASIWIGAASTTVERLFSGLVPIAIGLMLAAAAYFGGRPLWRLVETNFWSLNALAIQPGYALVRELLRHLAEKRGERSRGRGWTALLAGLIVAAISGAILALVLPETRWTGTLADLAEPGRLAIAALYNAVAIIAAYVAVAALVWGVADASMAQPEDLTAFAPRTAEGRVFHVAHLSDIHIVGERYGFRIESGRAGPRGNERLARLLARLAEIEAAGELDLVLLSGDMTDAGRAAEWAVFFDAIAAYPALARKMVALPGNHDLNVVDRANPARLDLPLSPPKRLRQMRLVAALDRLQGRSVRVVDAATGRPGVTLAEALDPHRAAIAAFADAGGMRRSLALAPLLATVFPMVLPPEATGGLGVVLLNSNAETHFSFTNALGFMPREQEAALAALLDADPHGIYLVALHHHVVEYPRPAKALSERIGTALVNGSWFVRRLSRFADRVIVMHGHRHIDWIGRCGPLAIVSAPSPVMNARDAGTTAFYVHAIGRAADGRITLHAPRRIEIEGETVA